MLQRLKLGEPGLTGSPQKSPQRNSLKRRTPLRSASRLKTRKPLGAKSRPKRGPRIDYSALAIPKVTFHKPAMVEYPDGRIVYNRRHPGGAWGYDMAIATMAARQGWLCSICGEHMRYEDRSFEHGDLRGMGGGRRNDDIFAVGPDGHYINSAAHGTCNRRRGSKRHEPYAIRIRKETA